MPTKYARRVSWDEFEQRVRRHRPSELVPAIAAVTAGMLAEDIRPPKERLILPWGLAAAAKESLRIGNEHRPSGVAARDIQEIAGAYNALQDPLMDGTEVGAVGAFFMRISHEQFPYQQSAFEEITRPYALFEMNGAAVPRSLIDDDFWQRALGCSLLEFWGTGFFLSVMAERNAGLVDLAVFDRPDLGPLFDEVPAATIRTCLQRHFAWTREAFRRRCNDARSVDTRLRRYDFNPLVRSPFVEWGESRFLAPVSHLILRPVATSGLYFIGREACSTAAEHEAFGQDLGALVEAYVGRQLEYIDGGTVLPEIRYEGDKRSVDWS